MTTRACRGLIAVAAALARSRRIGPRRYLHARSRAHRGAVQLEPSRHVAPVGAHPRRQGHGGVRAGRARGEQRGGRHEGVEPDDGGAGARQAPAQDQGLLRPRQPPDDHLPQHAVRKTGARRRSSRAISRSTASPSRWCSRRRGTSAASTRWRRSIRPIRRSTPPGSRRARRSSAPISASRARSRSSPTRSRSRSRRRCTAPAQPAAESAATALPAPEPYR